jgi:hypothetical protein
MGPPAFRVSDLVTPAPVCAHEQTEGCGGSGDCGLGPGEAGTVVEVLGVDAALLVKTCAGAPARCAVARLERVEDLAPRGGDRLAALPQWAVVFSTQAAAAAPTVP